MYHNTAKFMVFMAFIEVFQGQVISLKYDHEFVSESRTKMTHDLYVISLRAPMMLK